MIKRLRDRVNRASRAGRAVKANRATRYNERSNTRKFFQPIHNH